MAVEFKCQSCGRNLRVGDEFAGKQVRCPGCRQVVTVPTQQAPAAPPVRPENTGQTLEASPHPVPVAAGARPRRLTWLWIAGAGVVAAGLLVVVIVTLARSGGPSPGDTSGTATSGPVAKTPAPTATPPERAQPTAGPATPKPKPKPPMKPGSTDKTGGPLPRGWTSEKRRVKVATPQGETRKEITYYKNSIGMEFVRIPAGEFTMGSPSNEKDRRGDEGPQHRVRIATALYMAATEVTNQQYRLFKREHDSKSFEGTNLNADAQPAVYVSWEDARAFCAWLSRKDGIAYGLPTEAQWEYACRAGSRGRCFWGESERGAGACANVADRTAKRKWPSWAVFDTDDGYALTAPVGNYAANAYGLYDMIGNVWEWCADWYESGYYGKSPTDDPSGPRSGSARVFRGGGWGFNPWRCRSARRYGYGPGFRSFDLGFRLVRTE